MRDRDDELIADDDPGGDAFERVEVDDLPDDELDAELEAEERLSAAEAKEEERRELAELKRLDRIMGDWDEPPPRDDDEFGLGLGVVGGDLADSDPLDPDLED